MLNRFGKGLIRVGQKVEWARVLQIELGEVVNSQAPARLMRASIRLALDLTAGEEARDRMDE